MDRISSLQESTRATWVKSFALILFGVVVLAWPNIALVNVVWLTAVVALVLGVVDIVSGATNIGEGNFWWLRLLLGAGEVGVGAYLAQQSDITLSLFVQVVGVFLLVRGVLEAGFALDEGVESNIRNLLVALAVAAVAAGFTIWRYPQDTGVEFVWVLGLFALVTGPVSLALAARAR